MNITAKILPAHYFPNIILFKIFIRINQNFDVTIVAHFRGGDLQNTSGFFYNMLLIYLYFKMPKWLSIWIPPLCSRSKNLFLHKEINEKSCNTSLVKIITLSGCEKSSSHVDKLSPFAQNITLIP